MDIHITNHACVRYLERSLKLNLDKIKCKKLTDSDILDMLCINKNDLKKKIITDENKISNILDTIGGRNTSCKIGVGRSHQVVFFWKYSSNSYS